MSPKTPAQALPPEAITKAVDSYKETVWSMLALIHELTWDATLRQVRTDVVHLHGAAHARPKGDSVTPDLSLVVGSDFIVLGDVKMSFATDGKGRAKIAEQLQKYDEAATELARVRAVNGAEIGTLLLTHHTRKIDAADYLQSHSDFAPVHPFAVVSYVRTDQAQVFISLERSYGQIVPKARDDAFRRVRSIKLEHVLVRFGGVAFYDADPPLALVLTMMWDRVFSQMIGENSFARAAEMAGEGDGGIIESNGGKDEHPTAASEQGGPGKSRRSGILLKVEADAVGTTLRDRFSLRSVDKSLPGAPRQALVTRALQTLVQLGLAQAVEGTPGAYQVTYRHLRGGTLDYFAKKLGAKKKAGTSGTKPQERQLALF